LQAAPAEIALGQGAESSAQTASNAIVSLETAMTQPVMIQWSISSFFGWGVYGLNLALHWANDPEIEPVCVSPIDAGQISIDPLRERAILPFLIRSLQFQAQISRHSNGAATADAPLLLALGNGFTGSPAVHNVVLEGRPTIGVVFFEEALDAEAVRRGKQLSLIITGSTWNEQVLRAFGFERVKTILQGIDPTHFHPGPKLGVMRDRFLVFSGGKAEMRKGQDIVMAAFKIFAKSHPEATLVTAWHSPWPHFARSLDQTGVAAPVVFDKDGKLDVQAWAAANDIASEQIIDLGNVPNISMPSVLREMDAAVFANRSEGGTNLVAMECMACGIPVVLSRNTGHLDLIKDDNCYPLDDQRAVENRWNSVGDVACWGESQVDEVVERLEQIFADRAEARKRGLRAARMMQRLSWAETARQMKDVVLTAAKGAVREAA
jgi:glycosyltransferase involved in cell wall biosynthesis